jgi:hypothetical protein
MRSTRLGRILYDMVRAVMSARWLISGVFIIAAAPVSRAPRVHPTRSPGQSYTVTTVFESGPASGSSRTDTTVSDVRIAGDNWRTDTRRVPDPIVHNMDSVRRAFGTQAGLYMLRARGSSIGTVVDSARRQYFAFDMDSARRSAAQLMQRVPHAGDTVYVVRVQPDTVVDGRHTEHWRRTSAITFRMLMIGDLTTHSTSEIYIATDMQDMAFGVFDGMTQSLLAGAAYSRELEATEATLPRGLRVLTIGRTGFDSASHSRAPLPSGSVYTLRLSSIQYGDISDDVFAIPAGYQHVPPPVVPSFHAPPNPQK